MLRLRGFTTVNREYTLPEGDRIGTRLFAHFDVFLPAVWHTRVPAVFRLCLCGLHHNRACIPYHPAFQADTLVVSLDGSHRFRLLKHELAKKRNDPLEVDKEAVMSMVGDKFNI